MAGGYGAQPDERRLGRRPGWAAEERAADAVAEEAGGRGRVSPATRYSNCKFIWSHAGGALIGVASRVVGGISTAQLAAPAPMNSHLYHVRRFFYDTAGSTNPVLMQGIARLAGASQIVFGTDYPFGGAAPGPKGIADGLKTCGFTQEELRGIDRENALRILPK